MHKYLFLVISIILLTACNNSQLKIQELPIQLEDSRLFALTQHSPKTEQSLLIIQFSPIMWRWIQTDPLGSPLARLQLTHSGWKNDGFVMPNSQAEQLFSAITTYLSPNNPPFVFNKIQLTTIGKDYFVNNKKVWQITPQKIGVTITLADKSIWYLEEIKQ